MKFSPLLPIPWLAWMCFRKASLQMRQPAVNWDFSINNLRLHFFLASGTPSSTVSDHDRIPVVTSLPPAVDGHLRCFLRVSIPSIHWTIAKYPADVQVRLRWWGEDGDGVLFRYM